MATLDATIAKRFDITVKQGQSFDAVLTFLDSAGAPISLAGGTAKMSVRQTASPNDDCGCTGDTPFNAVYSQDFLPSITGISNNQLTFDETILLSPGRYKYDLVVEFLGGYTAYFLFGTFKVIKSYSKI